MFTLLTYAVIVKLSLSTYLIRLTSFYYNKLLFYFILLKVIVLYCFIKILYRIIIDTYLLTNNLSL